MPTTETLAVTDPAPQSPLLVLPRVGEIDLDRSFDEDLWPPVSCAGLVLHQSWLAMPEPGFQTATAWFAATPDSLVFFAEISDRSIGTAVTQDHEHVWELGDAFEIFLQPYGGDGYHEFQIAPNGRLLQLRYPAVGAPRDDGIVHYIYRAPLLEVRVRVEPDHERWRVAARLPVVPLLQGQARLNGEQWRVAFCRYDYYAGDRFRLSSSAFLTRPNFHRVGEWDRMIVPGGFATPIAAPSLS